jgi:argininosuccinate lyase
MAVVSVLPDAIMSIKPSRGEMAQAIDPTMMATDLADYLVQLGTPFREAHTLVSKIVSESQKKNIPLDAMPLSEMLALDSPQGEALQKVFDPLQSVSKRSVEGGTSRDAVVDQIRKASQILDENLFEVMK